MGLSARTALRMIIPSALALLLATGAGSPAAGPTTAATPTLGQARGTTVLTAFTGHAMIRSIIGRNSTAP